MHQKNDRSVHTDAKRIKANLARHFELMAKYLAMNLTREAASQRAAIDMGTRTIDRTCNRCWGTGCIDTPTSASDPCCPDCDGEGVMPSTTYRAQP